VVGVVGRSAQLGELARALDAATFRVVELLGEPGMGKTALLAELRAAAASRGARVAAGKATEFERLPFAMFSDAFGDAWTDLLTSVDTPDGRAALYRSARSLLPGTVLVLDDVHWADEASVELIEHVLRHPPEGAALLAMAYRPRQLPDRLATAFSGLAREEWWRRIEVGPLTPVEAAEFCGETVSHVRATELYDASGGNPFYLDALLRLDPGDRDELPDTVRAVLIGELAGLAPPVRLVAQAAAVLGEEFEAGLIGAVAQTEDIDTFTALDELIARDLIRQSVAGQRFRFRHPLLRSVVYGSAGAGWRIGAHGRAARLLAERGASLAVQATHLERSATIGDARAVEVLVGAADQATSLAPARAAHWLREALRLLGDRAVDQPELSMRLAHTLAVAGQLNESREILHEVLGRLPAGPSDQRLEAVTTLAMVERLLGSPTGVKRLLLSELGTGKGKAALELEVAAGAMRGSHFATAVSWGERALESATAESEHELIATITALLALAHTFYGSTAEAAAHLDNAVRMIDRAQDKMLMGQLESILRAGWTEVFLERYDDAVRHLTRGLELARVSGRSYLLADLLVGLAYACMWTGRLDEASRYADEAFEAAVLVGSDELRTMAAGVVVAVLLWTGEAANALRAAEKTVSEMGSAAGRGPTIAAGMLAQAKLQTGDAAGARSTLLDIGGGETLPHLEFPTRAAWLRTLAHAELALGDLAAAELSVQRAEMTASVSGLNGHRGHASLARGTILLAKGDAAGAAEVAATAAAAFEAVDMRLYQAQSHMFAGAALTTLEDRTRAMAEFGRAKALFAACGADPLFRQAEIHQRRVGGRNRKPTPDGQSPLSDRERQIAELVAAGHTNRQIAEQLFMSPKTVEAHLSRIFQKLGVKTRAAVAAAWSQGF
jgi:ATP/maltotriose-dependent transcriptional regulator MalT